MGESLPCLVPIQIPVSVFFVSFRGNVIVESGLNGSRRPADTVSPNVREYSAE